MILFLLACGFPHRLEKFVAPVGNSVAMPPPGQPPLAAVQYAAGTGELVPWVPAHVRDLNGTTYACPVSVTGDGRIEVRPLAPDTQAHVYLRHLGIGDFFEIKTVTGAIEGHISNEIRYLPGSAPLSGPWTLELRDISNVYNEYTFSNGDLLLLEIQHGDQVERYLFQDRRPGVWVNAGADALVRFPAPWMAEDVALSPAATLTLSLGYRSKDGIGVLQNVGDRMALLASVGLGVDQIAALSAPDNLSSAVRQSRALAGAVLVGGGLQLFGFLSVETLFNASAAAHPTEVAPWSFAVGFDAIRFSQFSQDAWQRLLYENALSKDGTR